MRPERRAPWAGSSPRAARYRFVMRVAWLPACVLALASCAPASFQNAGLHAPTRHAVFVGINDYIELGDEPGGDLLGAEHDARVVREVLEDRWGLDPANALTLVG